MATNLLLTGATGMVGREILARIVSDTRFDRVLCVVRPPVDRFQTLLTELGLGTSARIGAISGDVTEPNLGTSDSHALDDVTHVIHCAATVAFDHPLEEARRINVGGTKTMLNVCRRLPKLTRLDAVSTSYVAGKRRGLIMETDLAGDHGFHNTYEQTKYECEVLLRDAMRELPIAVQRPSIVVGDSRTGRTGSWKVLYWPLKILARGFLPAVPYDPNARLDIVPVDFVADATIALSHDPAALGRTFHLAAGPGRDTTMGELASQLLAKFNRKPPLRVPPIVWRRLVRPALMMLPSSTLRKTLRTGLVYRPYLALRLQFDAREADECLSRAGVHCPRVVDYIEKVVDAAVASDFGRKS